MDAKDIAWKPAPPVPELPPDEVHVWRIALDTPAHLLGPLHYTLSQEELDRAARFHFEHHRRRFIVAHAVLRSILGLYLRCLPADVSFCHGDQGKPSLPEGANAGDIRFNLSHSGEGALLGVTRGRDIGIDLEQVRPMPNLEELAGRFFAAGEVADLAAVAHSERCRAFFRCWTRKEAYIKALGLGLAFPLDRFRVSLKPGEPVRLLEVDGSVAKAAAWDLCELAPWEGYVGCAAALGQGLPLKCWDALV
jgi:4'-phosphopantetheinyl transferase